jgi:hypothetical protein
MLHRDLELDAPPASSAPIHAPRGSVHLYSSPNWTAIWFFATLAILHACIALPAFAHYRWEGYLSAIFCPLFLIAAWTCYKLRCEISFDPGRREIRLLRGVGRLKLVRAIPFDDVHAVRLTLPARSGARDARIEVLCDNEDIDCPPTNMPREDALCLAVLMDVRLVKVAG